MQTCLLNCAGRGAFSREYNACSGGWAVNTVQVRVASKENKIRMSIDLGGLSFDFAQEQSESNKSSSNGDLRTTKHNKF